MVGSTAPILDERVTGAIPRRERWAMAIEIERVPDRTMVRWDTKGVDRHRPPQRGASRGANAMADRSRPAHAPIDARQIEVLE